MPKAVLDTTVLVSALLTPRPQGASYVLLQYAKAGAFELCLSDDILEETAQTLRQSRLKERYAYSDADVVTYCQELALLATIVGDLPEVHAVRDPDDDMIVASALAAGAGFLVARDQHLLSLGTYEGIEIVTPEAFLQLLRASDAE
jgi:uncharacterized protein